MGPELDALVSREVFRRPLRRVERVRINGEWREGETWLGMGEDPERPMAGSFCGMAPPRYSADIAAAWKVVEAMRNRGYNADIWNLAGPADAGWRCRFANDAGMDKVNAATAPLAICRAALAAVEDLTTPAPTEAP